MHADIVTVDVNEAIEAQPLEVSHLVTRISGLLALVGVGAFCYQFYLGDSALAWGSLYASLLTFMGVAAGGVIIAAIFQIVRAEWSASLRRLTEANVAYLPVAYTILLLTYFGRESLFPWATTPRAGSEWWMEPNRVYIRTAIILGFLFLYMTRFVLLSLKCDVSALKAGGVLRSNWNHSVIEGLGSDSDGTQAEISSLQRKLSWNAPVLIMCYALTYSMFSFEMIMATDKYWMSNLFGAFMFVGNVYVGWAALNLMTIFYAKKYPLINKATSTNQLWDLGKLTFGFCMLWGYFFLSQFLPQWYGNLPEETQWLILRTREYPWKGWGWITISCCFFIPFILLLCRDIKKTPITLAFISMLIITGMWTQMYLIIMPQFSPDRVPFSIIDVLIALGFLGSYVWCVHRFLTLTPALSVGHPLLRRSNRW